MSHQEKQTPHDIVASWTPEEVRSFVSLHYARYILSSIGKQQKASEEGELMRHAINRLLSFTQEYDQIGLYIPKTTPPRK